MITIIKNTPNNLVKVTWSYFITKTVALSKFFDMLRIALLRVESFISHFY